MIITLDGPAASGKSTIAHLLARDLSITYLNTGLLYRAFAYCLVDQRSYNRCSLSSPLATDIAFVLESSLIRYDYDPQAGALLWYNDQNIAHKLKTPEIDQWASIVSAHSGVRKALLQMQRDIGKQKDVIVEGRDCGTVVFPYADYKFFMSADLETRARRWHHDQLARHVVISYEEAYKSLQERDLRDSTRDVAPLQIPSGAIVIDTTPMTLPEVANVIKGHIQAGII